MKKAYILMACLLAATTTAWADDETRELFVTDSLNASTPYRIPAIGRTKTGRLIALDDYRLNGSDIGCSTQNGGEIDIVGRKSDDNGKTWSEIFTLVKGKGDNSSTAGYGDPCIVADRDGQAILVCTCVGSGTDSFWSGNQGTALFRSLDNGDTWTQVKTILADEKKLQLPEVTGYFFTSGRICQSRMIKKGHYYRIYVGLACQKDGKVCGNYVLFSDDFGDTWSVLGSNETPCVGSLGNECKLEEMPDGSVVISSRYGAQTGRLFNTWSYEKSFRVSGFRFQKDSDGVEGSWGIQAASTARNKGTACVTNDVNGAIQLLPAKRMSDGKAVWLVLQSLALGPKRANVGIYYKEIANTDDLVPANFARDWSGPYQVTDKNSAYSTMCITADNKIGFFYEETTHGYAYTGVFKPLTLQTITDGKYEFESERVPEFQVIEHEGIDELKAESLELKDGCYNLLGQVVTPGISGLIVIKDRKIIR